MTEMTPFQTSEALEVLDHLCGLRLPDYEKTVLHRLRARFRVRMADVLELVPGNTVAQKAKILHTTRQTIYSWRDDITRPRGKEARRLAKVIGYKYSVAEITGDADASLAA